MPKLVIIGAGGHGREVLDIVDALNARGTTPPIDLLGFLVDTAFGTAGTTVRGHQILGNLEWLRGCVHDVEVVCAVGAPALRLRLAQRAAALGARFGRLVHPSAVCSSRVLLAPGVVIAAGCVLTSDIELHDHAHLNVGCTLAHDTICEPFVTLAPGVHAAGAVRFDEGCDVGVGACVLPRTRVGRWSIVGGGAAVVSDVPPNSTVVGVPARVVKTRPGGWHLSGGVSAPSK
jgi:sugar O-acyltransferase (sialic acid O-acetyltransferase NeuD family)